MGHIMFSPVRVADVTGAALAPMAVLPGHQGRGIGGQLVRSGIRRLEESGCPFVLVLGHARYYPRFGFPPASGRGITCEWEAPDDAFMVLVLDHVGMAPFRDGRSTGPSSRRWPSRNLAPGGRPEPAPWERAVQRCTGTKRRVPPLSALPTDQAMPSAGPRVSIAHKARVGLMNGNIRQARPSDAAAMHRVRISVQENRLTQVALSERDYAVAVDETGGGWVVELQEGIVAFAVGNSVSGSIWALFVEPAQAGKGYGRRLHDIVVAWLWEKGHDQLWLTTEPGTRAERFYAEAGWRQAGMAPGGEIRFELKKSNRALQATREDARG